MTEWASLIFGDVGWAMRRPKVVICQANPGDPSITHVIDVCFPGGLTDHLNHGDTAGLSRHGGE